MQIYIKKFAKGKKDRYVGLNPLLLDVLRSYVKSTSQKPLRYLFESLTPGIAYSKCSAQIIFHKAKDMAGIKKDVSFHSFATHLLKIGINVIFIKDLLGHFNIKTTEKIPACKKRATGGNNESVR